MMTQTPNVPLLSICIPTYNRARLLQVMLQALLPQVHKLQGLVEVWVLDNASTDETPKVLESSRALGPFQIKRQCSTIPGTRNLIDGPLTLARGRYVWVLGDHNLLLPGALERIVGCLQQCMDYQVFYVNFRAAAYPDQFPASAVDGHDGPFQYLGNPEISTGPVSKWWQLLRPYSAACTQLYVHIVRTTVWQSFWAGTAMQADFSCALSIYPHTMTIVQTCFHEPAMVVAEPVITIFNGAQSWSDPANQVRVYFRGLPDLLRRMQKAGLPRQQYAELVRHVHRPNAVHAAARTMNLLGPIGGLRLLLKNVGIHPCGWQALMLALPDGLAPQASRRISQLLARLRNYRQMYVYNCRPARWIRRLISAESP